MAHNTTSIRVIAAGTRVCSSIVCSVSHGVPAPQHMLSNPYITQAAAVLENPNPAIWSVPLGEPWPRMHSKTALAAVAVAEPGLGVWGDIQSITGGAIRTLTPFFSYYGIHSLMFGGYPPTAIGYPPTAIGCTPTAISYPPTAIGYPPTAIGCTPTAISYPPTAIGYPPAAIVGRIGHSEFFFFITAPPDLYASVCTRRCVVRMQTTPTILKTHTKNCCHCCVVSRYAFIRRNAYTAERCALPPPPYHTP